MNIFDTPKVLNDLELFWQYPVITEEEFYNQNKSDPKYCGLPWATIIDKGYNLNEIVDFISNMMYHSDYYTCCQHIHFRKLFHLFKTIGITTVYSPHKIKGENTLNGIRISPCPLYAVNIEDQSRNKEFRNKHYMKLRRKYLYSFIGGYQPQYISPIRKNIFKLDRHKHNLIKYTGDWHFNSTVYSTLQNKYNKLNIDENHNIKTSYYNVTLLNSRYTLCPSGSGPNSIRFWESLACGSIPVLLSDNLDLPYGIDWDNTIVVLPEHEIDQIEYVLSSISEDEENTKRRNCILVYNKLKHNFKNV